MKNILFIKLLIVIFLFSPHISAKTLKLVTGDLPPYSGEHLPEGGMLTAIVRAAFEERGYQVDVKYQPWARGYASAQNLLFDATFPYGKNAQREVDFLYSDVYFVTDRRLYSRPDLKFDPKNLETLNGKTYCSPVGFTISKELQPLVENKKIKMVNPKDQLGCLRMISLKRADFAVIAASTGDILLQEKDLSATVVASEKSFGRNENFLIVSKSHPKAVDLIREFNTGLKKIKENQKYDLIIKRLVK